MIPPHERRILEAHVRKVTLSTLALETRPLNEYEERELRELIKLRVKGLPLQYLTGSQGFYGREFYVNTGVLIPRPETEGLVELVLKRLPAPDLTVSSTPRLLQGVEFGAGSGCISLTLALERGDVRMVASECSEDALAVAHENARRFRVGAVEFIHVSESPEVWQYANTPVADFLVSNPPYLLFDEEIAQDVKEHEPPEALYSPDGDPLYFYRFLLELMNVKVAPEGFGAFEIAEHRGAEIASLFRDAGFEAEVLKDLTERDRYLVVRRKNAESQ